MSQFQTATYPCQQCPWHHGLQDFRNISDLLLECKKQVIYSTSSSVCSQKIGEQQPQDIDAEVSEMPAQQEVKINKNIQKPQQIKNTYVEIPDKKSSRRKNKANMVKSANKQIEKKAKTIGKPMINKYTKVHDFNKYFVRKIKYVYKKNFSDLWDNRSTINNENFERLLQKCKQCQLKGLLRSMITYFKKPKINRIKEFPFDRDRLSQDKILAYLRHSQSLLDILTKNKKK